MAYLFLKLNATLEVAEAGFKLPLRPDHGRVVGVALLFRCENEVTLSVQRNGILHDDGIASWPETSIVPFLHIQRGAVEFIGPAQYRRNVFVKYRLQASLSENEGRTSLSDYATSCTMLKSIDAFWVSGIKKAPYFRGLTTLGVSRGDEIPHRLDLLTPFACPTCHRSGATGLIISVLTDKAKSNR